MDGHPTDDELVQHYYRDLEEARAEVIGVHLHRCLTCQTNFDEIRATLEVASRHAVPEPPADFEAVVWSRVRRQLDDSQRASGVWRSPRAFVVFGTLAATLLAFAGGFLWVHARHDRARPGITVQERSQPGPTSSQERVLLTALNDHFSQAEVLLVELMNSPEAASSELTFERTTADELVASGRLYRQTARQTGDTQFAQLLDDLEGVLVEVARSPDRLDPHDFQSLRTRIDTDGLLFKVRAVTNQVRTRQQTLLAQQ